MKRTVSWACMCVLLAAPAALGQGDPEVIEKIVTEGKDNSQVWQYLTHLSEDIGTRLTGSSRLMEANAWTRDVFHDLGLKNAHLRKWGEIPVRFDRGPSEARMVRPAARDFEFTTPAWSAGTSGPVRGRIIKRPKTLEALEAVQDDLKGAWILSEPRARRRRGGRRGGRGREMTDEQRAANELRQKIDERLGEAGIVGTIAPTGNELVNTGGVRGWRDLDFTDLPTDVSIRVRRSDYDAMNSRLADGEDVTVEADLQNHFVEGPFGVYNTIAEIVGTEWPEQVIIVSGHLDSWDGPGSKASQDNGTGCAVALEAARILMAAGAKPKRTIRFCLWTGEEQGLLGSRGYVQSLSEEELANISVVFVDDGGTNYEGGLNCIESMAPMLREATAAVNEAFPDMTVEIRVRERMPRGGGSDHASFNRVGVPGFFWDEVGIGGREGKNYRFIHHTQHDTMRYAIEEYLVQSATCSAITAYNLACADTMLPRQEGGTTPPPRRRPERVAAAATDQKKSEPNEDKPFKVVMGPVSGEWKVTLANDEATIKLEMSEDGRVRGTLESGIGAGALTGCSFDKAAGTVKFSYEAEMGVIDFRAKVNGNEMTGTLGVEEMFSREFTAKRAGGKAASAGKAAAEIATETKKASSQGAVEREKAAPVGGR